MDIKQKYQYGKVIHCPLHIGQTVCDCVNHREGLYQLIRSASVGWCKQFKKLRTLISQYRTFHNNTSGVFV